jgi:hypothetical protein
VLTLSADVLRGLARHSLFASPGGYQQLEENVFAWVGERPGAGWHIHGWTEAHPFVVHNGRRQRITLRKRRWRKVDRSETCHSRPPDDLGLRHDALLVALELWCCLDTALGLHRYPSLFEPGPARRTVQRWLARALPLASATQHALRHAIIERSEPRPVETLFPGGLSPPEALLRRSRHDPSTASTLWRGLALLFVGASKLGLSLAPLLAEARWSSTSPQDPFLIA